jgi:hypothetical protein
MYCSLEFQYFYQSCLVTCSQNRHFIQLKLPSTYCIVFLIDRNKKRMADVDFTVILYERKTLYRKQIPEKKQYQDNKISKKYVIDTKIVVSKPNYFNTYYNQLGSQSVILKSISAIFFVMVNCIVLHHTL